MARKDYAGQRTAIIDQFATSIALRHVSGAGKSGSVTTYQAGHVAVNLNSGQEFGQENRR
jgi:hypothetical protein